MNALEKSRLESQIIQTLETCFDPEIPVNIYELGLVYLIAISDEADVEIQMTLTTPHCPAATSLPGQVRSKVSSIPNVRQVEVTVVWEPPWTPERMSEAAKLQLGLI
jgi:FeS assembly SUF system protein